MSNSHHLVRTASLWSLLTTKIAPASKTRKRSSSRARFVGDVLCSPVHGRAVAINYDAGTLLLETAGVSSRVISSPIDGQVVQIEASNGTLRHGIFSWERDKQASLTLHILCRRTYQIIQLALVTKPQGVTSRVRLFAKVLMQLTRGETIAYVAGIFETRLLVPPTSFLKIEPNANLSGAKTIIGTVISKL